MTARIIKGTCIAMFVAGSFGWFLQGWSRAVDGDVFAAVGFIALSVILLAEAVKMFAEVPAQRRVRG